MVIKPEEVPQSYWETQARIAREQGHGDIEVTDEMKAASAKNTTADQNPA